MKKETVNLISASAGSGKTYALTAHMATGIRDGIEPESVLAVTFTNKAADELLERVRGRLLKEGLWNEAQRVFDGYIGTVHSVCGRIMSEFALDAGLSPTQDVIPEEDANTIFSMATVAVVASYEESIADAAHRFTKSDWNSDVKKIVEQARANGLSPEDLAQCAERSWESLESFLPSSSLSEKTADKALMEAMQDAVNKVDRDTDDTKTTTAAIDQIKAILASSYAVESWPWSRWVKLSKLAAGKKSDMHFIAVRDAASKHLAHPRLHRDIEGFIKGIFDCATDAMGAYQDYKTAYGLVDFADQEALCLNLLSDPNVSTRLKERIDLALVDEFQDTSPIQLALFSRFAKFASRSVWVGDKKQAIYGFRGTDPDHMSQVITNLSPEVCILPDSYRSRPEIVRFTTAVFSPPFKSIGMPEEQVKLNPRRKSGKGQGPALRAFRLETKNLNDDASAIAGEVKKILQDCETKYLIEDKKTKELRPPVGSDIGILCKQNTHCEQIAAAIENAGVRATLPKTGLLGRSECILAQACLRYLISKEDTLAAAEVIHLCGDRGSEWLKEWIQAKTHGIPGPETKNDILKALDEARDGLLNMTPAEALDLAIQKAGIYGIVLGWDDHRRRLANLEKMRSMASEYEDAALVTRQAATPLGLVAHFAQAASNKSDQQAEGGDQDAVCVSTYHSAKGLEWPIVILMGLQTAEKGRIFGIQAMEAKEFDPSRPLYGRWIRYWPWPYDAQQKGTGLLEAIQESQLYQEVVDREKREFTRLLYVGMTRARDYLVFAARKGQKLKWLETLVDENGSQVLDLPDGSGKATVKTGQTSHAFLVSKLAPSDLEESLETREAYLVLEPDERKDFPPARIVPSHMHVGEEPVDCHVEEEKIGSHIHVTGKPDMNRIGNALHAFFASADELATAEALKVQAENITTEWTITNFEAADLCVVWQNLLIFLRNNYGKDITLLREWPIQIRNGNQIGSGWIDLLVDTPQGYVIVDHKSFLGDKPQRKKKAVEYQPQLALYAEAVGKASGRPVLATWIHLPLSGRVMRIGP